MPIKLAIKWGNSEGGNVKTRGNAPVIYSESVRCEEWDRAENGKTSPWLKAFQMTLLTKSYLLAVHSILHKNAEQRQDESKNSQTTDSFLLVLILGRKYIIQGKQNIRWHRKELFRDN